MKNYFTFCTLVAFLSIFSVGSTLANGHSANSNQASWLNQYEECFVVNHRESLISWMNWDISASSSMMMGCPSNIDVALGAGECGREVSFNFAFTDITVSNLTTNPNVNSSAITSTTYCSSGQTRYSRIFQHTGPTGHTDLVISSIHLGVFQSVNNPVVTFNFYTLSGSLLGTHSEIIPNISQGIHTISIPSSNVIKVPANSSYVMEVVTNAPHISVFKIGRNQYGNAPGFAEATIQAAACPSVLNNEIDPAWSGITPNSIVFGVTGIPEDYKYTNISNGYESGDYFPIGTHAMSYTVTDASGNITPCVFNINVTGYANITGAIACNDLVQVSLGEDCETVVTPDMLLQGSEYGCYDKYTVQIIANNGANLGNIVTSANIGQTLKTQVIGPNGNSCWGEIKVEDKFGPDFECHDIYATCSTDLSPGSPLSTRVPVSARILDGTIRAATTSATSFTIPVANLDGTTITDLNVFLDISHNRLADLAANITSPDGVTVPLFLNLPCTSPNMMVTFDDQSTNGSVACVGADPAVSGDFKPFNPLSIFNGKPLNGDWVITVFDLATGEGGTVNHLDIVFSQAGGFIPFPTSNAVTFTHVVDNTYLVNGIDYCSAATLTYTDTVIEEDCESAYAKIIERCWTGYDNKGNQGNTCCQTIYVYRNGLSTLEFPKNFDGLNGNPAPLSCLIYGDSIPPTSVTGLPSGDLCYNVEITEPTDVRIDICKNSYKLIRTHKVIEWCSGQVIVHNQIVKVADHAGPVLTCPADVTISTDEYVCSATYIVPKPSIGAECSDILDYHLSYNPHNTLASDYIYENVNQLGGRIAGLPQGDSWIKWTVTDECGNSSECTFKVRVEDHVLPNPVCDQSTVAAITGNGKAVVNAETFDDGSVDNCGIVKYEARKMTDKCGFGTTNFTATVEFCCEEVNTSVMVEFRVTDRYGNSNTCMVEVKVQDKLPPYITKCPADITLDCQADYKDLKVTGEPEYKDNCTVISVKSQDDVKISQCGVGTVTRTWTIEDKQGYKNSCVQVITLIDKKPFNANEIVWPLNYETKKCYSKLEPKDLPVGYDKPTFGDDNCSLVAAHYKDQIFNW